MQIYYDRDANLNALSEKKIAVIGYGSQGFAQSNNLRESGCNVTVGLRSDSPSTAKAEKSGLPVLPVAQAAGEADVVMMLVATGCWHSTNAMTWPFTSVESRIQSLPLLVLY